LVGQSQPNKLQTQKLISKSNKKRCSHGGSKSSFNSDHKKIGMLYLVTTLVFFAMADFTQYPTTLCVW